MRSPTPLSMFVLLINLINHTIVLVFLLFYKVSPEITRANIYLHLRTQKLTQSSSNAIRYGSISTFVCAIAMVQSNQLHSRIGWPLILILCPQFCKITSEIVFFLVICSFLLAVIIDTLQQYLQRFINIHDNTLDPFHHELLNNMIESLNGYYNITIILYISSFHNIVPLQPHLNFV